VIIGSSVAGVAAGLGGWALLADLRVVPGRSVVDQALGRCDVSATPPPEANPGRLVKGSFYSTHRKRSVGYVLAYPPKVAAGAKLPVCLVLHGYGVNQNEAFDGMAYHRVLAAAVAAKVPPFVLASVDGGDGYWHPRADDDPLGMLLTDFPTVLAQHGLPVKTFGLLGWSMGGYGALLAATEQPTRFAAVVANAPAFWRSYDEAHSVNEAAFGSEQEWSTWGDLLARAPKLGGVTLRIDCGESDPFLANVNRLKDRLPDKGVVHVSKGCHDTAYVRSVAADQLRFLGTALTPKSGDS
jgi:S-formylglutathione hydrolase FrmB